MGIEDARDYADIDHSLDKTIEELVGEYGPEAVRRGLAYMDSLSEAEKNYKENPTPEDYQRGLEQSGVEGDLSGVSDEWKASMDNNGLGLDNDE